MASANRFVLYLLMIQVQVTLTVTFKTFCAVLRLFLMTQVHETLTVTFDSFCAVVVKDATTRYIGSDIYL